MPHPIRLRLSRRKGFSLQAHSHAVNGLPAANVARPSRWGNPFRVGHEADTPCDAVLLFMDWLLPDDGAPEPDAARMMSEIEALRGKNLACWCPLDGCCHADVLLKLANGDDE